MLTGGRGCGGTRTATASGGRRMDGDRSAKEVSGEGDGRGS